MKKAVVLLLVIMIAWLTSCNKTDDGNPVDYADNSGSTPYSSPLPTLSPSPEPSQEPLAMIYDINDWEKLGLSKNDERYKYLNAFITGDTTTLAEFAGLPTEAYDEYKTVKLGEYTITLEDNPYSSEKDVVININVLSSDIYYYSVGQHSFIIRDDFDTHLHNPELENSWEYTKAQAVLNLWFNCTGYYDLTDYLSGDPQEWTEWHRHEILDYLQLVFGENIEWTLEAVQDYAEKYLGVVGLVPPEDLLTGDGTYDGMGHGLYSIYYRYIDEVIEGGLIIITVQFYADYANTIESHTVIYRMQEIDGGYKILDSNVIFKSPYEPKVYLN